MKATIDPILPSQGRFVSLRVLSSLRSKAARTLPHASRARPRCARGTARASRLTFGGHA